MDDNFKESISAFIDDEHDIPEQDLQQLQSDSEARALWQRYHLIRDVMTQHYVSRSNTLAQRISASIANENVISISEKRVRRGRRVWQQVAGFAMAATIAAVAIIVVQQQNTLQPTPQRVTVAPITTAPVRLTSAVENKLSGYLVNHNEYSATVRMQGMLPYTRIVSVTPSQRVVEKINTNAQR